MLRLLTGISSLLISTLLVHTHALHFSKTSPDFFLVFVVADTSFCVGLQNKKVALLDAGSRVECPRHINRLKKNFKKHDLWYEDL